MGLERLKTAKRKTVGTNQTTKAVERGLAQTVFVAKDADSHVTRHLLQLCRQRGIEVVEVESMAALGRACGVEVGTASAAILGD